MTDTDALPVVCVLGAWASGTTAVTGYLARLGGHTCPPHLMTNDVRTPDSHESLGFRQLCLSAIDEPTLERIGSSQDFTRDFGSWLADRHAEGRSAGKSFIVLKHPLSAFLIPEINQVCRPTWLVVHRPFASIEATRIRRNWHAYLGAAGASRIYGALFSALIEEGVSGYSLSFPRFLDDPGQRRRLTDALALAPSPEQVAAAEAWLR